MSTHHRPMQAPKALWLPGSGFLGSIGIRSFTKKLPAD